MSIVPTTWSFRFAIYDFRNVLSRYSDEPGYQLAWSTWQGHQHVLDAHSVRLSACQSFSSCADDTKHFLTYSEIDETSIWALHCLLLSASPLRVSKCPVNGMATTSQSWWRLWTTTICTPSSRSPLADAPPSMMTGEHYLFFKYDSKL
jgi:hypothetical protein